MYTSRAVVLEGNGEDQRLSGSCVCNSVHSVLDFQSQCLSLAPMFSPGSSVTSTPPFINQECMDTGKISSLAVLIGLRS